VPVSCVSAEGMCKDSWRKRAGSVQEVHSQRSGSAQTTFRRRADNGNGMRREEWNQGLTASDWLRVKRERGARDREAEREMRSSDLHYLISRDRDDVP
jgi:hypothetical protein